MRALDLQGELAKAQEHLGSLAAQEQHLLAQLRQIQDARQQMLGRYRLLNEMAGTEEPLMSVGGA